MEMSVRFGATIFQSAMNSASTNISSQFPSVEPNKFPSIFQFFFSLSSPRCRVWNTTRLEEGAVSEKKTLSPPISKGGGD